MLQMTFVNVQKLDVLVMDTFNKQIKNAQEIWNASFAVKNHEKYLIAFKWKDYQPSIMMQWKSSTFSVLYEHFFTR